MTVDQTLQNIEYVTSETVLEQFRHQKFSTLVDFSPHGQAYLRATLNFVFSFHSFGSDKTAHITTSYLVSLSDRV